MGTRERCCFCCCWRHSHDAGGTPTTATSSVNASLAPCSESPRGTVRASWFSYKLSESPMACLFDSFIHSFIKEQEVHRQNASTQKKQESRAVRRLGVWGSLTRLESERRAQ